MQRNRTPVERVFARCHTPVGLGDIRIVNLGEVGLEEGKDAEIKSGSEARHSSTSIGGELLETISLRRDDDPQHEAAR